MKTRQICVLCFDIIAALFMRLQTLTGASPPVPVCTFSTRLAGREQVWFANTAVTSASAGPARDTAGHFLSGHSRYLPPDSGLRSPAKDSRLAGR